MARLTIAQRNQAIEMLICGTSNRQVGKFFRAQTIPITDYGIDTSQQELQTKAGRPNSLSDRHRRRKIHLKL